MTVVPSTSSAVPLELRIAGRAHAAVDAPLGRAVRGAGAALDALRATSGWQDLLPDVPPLDIDLGAVRGRIDRLRALLDAVAAAFEAVGSGGGVSTATNAALAERVGALAERDPLVRDGDRWIWTGTADDDLVRVEHRDDGTHLLVGHVHGGHVRWDDRRLTAAQAAGLVLATGAGDDIVQVAPDVSTGVTVWTSTGDDVVGWFEANAYARIGGGGDDRVFLGAGDDAAVGGAGDDELWGSAGDDVLDGQTGDDLVDGGTGDDNLDGGGGDDVVVGGAGSDVLEGGHGADRLDGGAGADLLSGGRDDDQLDGGSGDDVFVGGSGTDVVDGGIGTDRAVADHDDRVLVAVESTEVVATDPSAASAGEAAVDLTTRPDGVSAAAWSAWRAAVEEDLDLLRSTATGRAGLAALDQTATTHGRTVGVLPGSTTTTTPSTWPTSPTTAPRRSASAGSRSTAMCR